MIGYRQARHFSPTTLSTPKCTLFGLRRHSIYGLTRHSRCTKPFHETAVNRSWKVAALLGCTFGRSLGMMHERAMRRKREENLEKEKKKKKTSWKRKEEERRKNSRRIFSQFTRVLGYVDRKLDFVENSSSVFKRVTSERNGLRRKCIYRYHVTGGLRNFCCS